MSVPDSNAIVAGSDPFEQALASYEAGNMADAEERVSALLRTAPQRHEVQHLAGDIASKLRRPRKALEFYRRAVEQATDNDARALSWAAIGLNLRELGNLNDAEDAYRRASLLAPHVAQYTLDLTQTLSDEGKFETAMDLLRTMAARRPGDPNPYWAMGALLLQWQRAAEALAAYEIAIKLNPDYSAMYIYAGSVHAMLGDFSKAEENFRHALSLPGDAPAYFQLSQLKKFTTGDSDIAAMEARLETSAPKHIDVRIDAAFGLAKAYDDIKDYGRAFHYLKIGNDLKKETFYYDVTDEARSMDGIAALLNTDFLKRYEGHSGSDLEPIFILGMPRSGTTLLEQMLAAHSQVKAGGELSYLSRVSRDLGNTWEKRGDRAPGSDEEVFADLARAAGRYAELTEGLRYRHPRFTDKMPENFAYVGIIHLLFPKAKIIHCRRDPVANCFSCYQRRFGTANYFSFDLHNLGQFYGSYVRLMQHWHAVMPGRILDVQYEDTIANPEQAIRRVLDFCGLEFEASCLDFHNVKRAVSTSSNFQVRKPIYQTSKQHWHHYREHLRPLIDSLRSVGISVDLPAQDQ